MNRQLRPCVFFQFCIYSCALYLPEIWAHHTHWSVNTHVCVHAHAPNCKHFNTNTVHYILNLEGPLQFCKVILSFAFFFFLHSRRHCDPIFGEMPIFNFWNSHWADRVDKEGAVSKRAPSTTYSFSKATAHWIKMDGGINMTTHWRAFQVALVAPEDALRNESTHNRACTLNCRCTTQAHMINVSGKPMALDRFFLSGNHDM